MLEDVRYFWKTARKPALLLYASCVGLAVAAVAGVASLLVGNVLALSICVFLFLLCALPVFVIGTVDFAQARRDRKRAKSGAHACRPAART